MDDKELCYKMLVKGRSTFDFDCAVGKGHKRIIESIRLEVEEKGGTIEKILVDDNPKNYYYKIEKGGEVMTDNLNVGELKKILADLDDNYSIELRVRVKMTDKELSKMLYPYPWNTEITKIVFDDVGVSDKVLCLGCEIKELPEYYKKRKEKP